MRGGDVMLQNGFTDPFTLRGWRANDFTAGEVYAIDRGWIEVVLPYSYRLTQAGFAEA